MENVLTKYFFLVLLKTLTQEHTKILFLGEKCILARNLKMSIGSVRYGADVVKISPV